MLRREALPVAAEEGRLGQRREQRARVAEPHRDAGRRVAASPDPVPVDEHDRPPRRASGSGRRPPCPRGTTSGRAWSECGATNVVAIASSPHISTGPPFERLYAVEPDGRRADDRRRRARARGPRRRPPTPARPSARARRTSTTTSLTATCRACRPALDLERRQLDDLELPARTPARARPRARPAASTLRKPTRPKLTPITGTPVPRNVRSARSIVPSPPSTTTRSASAGRRAPRGRAARPRPARRRARRRRPARPHEPLHAVADLARPAVRDERGPRTGRTASADGGVDPALELIGSRRALARDRGGRRTPGSPSGPGRPESTTPTTRHPSRAPRRRPRAARAGARAGSRTTPLRRVGPRPPRTAA